MLEMEIIKEVWKAMVGLKQRGVQVRKGETLAIEEFNIVQYYSHCQRKPGGEIKKFHVRGPRWKKGCWPS